MNDNRETTQGWWRKPWLLSLPGLLLAIFSLPEQQDNLEAWRRLVGSVGRSTWQVAAGYTAIGCFAVAIILEAKARLPAAFRACRGIAERFVILLGEGMAIGRSRLKVRDDMDQPPLPSPTYVDESVQDDENWITVSTLWPGLVRSSHVATLAALNGKLGDPALRLTRLHETAHTLIERFSKEQAGSAYRHDAVHRDTWEEWLRDLVKGRVEKEADWQPSS